MPVEQETEMNLALFSVEAEVAVVLVRLALLAQHLLIQTVALALRH
jgi:hypothetical protein